MKSTIPSNVGLAVILLGYAGAASGQPFPVGTAFTYQGTLERGGGAVTDTCDFEFTPLAPA